MQAIGERLREARMRQQIDIAEVEHATKIRAKYLRALENEEFQILPGSTFVKTFLRTYAEYLGLDAQLLVEEYRAQHESRGADELMQSFAPQPPQRERRRRFAGAGGPPGPGTAVVVLVLALLVVFAILGLTGDSGDEGGESEGTQAGERGSKERDERRDSRRRRRRAAPTSVRLRVVPSDSTYVCVDRGPETNVVFEGTLTSGRTFRGRRLRINLGRSSATLRVNGKRVRFERGPQAVGFDFTPRRTRRLPEPQRPCV